MVGAAEPTEIDKALGIDNDMPMHNQYMSEEDELQAAIQASLQLDQQSKQ